MPRQDPTYLYQYKNSSNYFFRIRRGFFRTSRYHVNRGYFIASLRTSCVREAKWLAAFIRMEFEKGMEKILMIDENLRHMKPMAETAEPPYGDNVLSMDDALFAAFEEEQTMVTIRKRFDVLLALGMSLMKKGIADYEKFKVNLEDDDIKAITVNRRKRDLAEHILRGFTDERIEIPQNKDVATRLLQECLKADQQVMQALIECEINRDKLGDTQALSMSGMKDALSFKGFQMELKDLIKDQTLFPQKAETHYSLDYQYSVFRDEKAREISTKSVEKYDYAMSLLKAELGESFDCRTFNKIVT